LEAFIAFHQLHPEYKLLFAGQGDEKYTSRLKQLASKHCPEAVCFLGHRNDVGQLMEQATALIVGSYSEGFGRMTAEACFKGCIVIGRDTGGTKEIIENTNGLMFHNIDMLKQQMIKVASMTPKEYLEIASIAQQRAIEQYSIESNVQQTFALYQQIIDKAL
jgi:glycosyltransferase involved in cell wall biosynthesis